VAPGDHAILVDDTHLYVVDLTAGGSIRRVPRDGSAAPVVIHALDETESAATVLLSAGCVVFREASSGTFRFVPKAGGAAAQPFFTNAETVSAFSDGPYVYVSSRNGSALAAREDGFGFVEYATTIADAHFTYLASTSFRAGGGAEPGTVIVVEDDGSEQTLRALGGPTRALGPALGTLSGYTQLGTVALAEASGSATLVAATDASTYTDLFFVDTARAGSLVPLGRTPGAGELFVGTQGCSSARGAPWPALLAFAAAAALRRRRG
jgi:hypothetical protein